jgi:hypothetical protein
LRKENPIEKVIEEREKERLGMIKHRISLKGNTNSSTIDVLVVVSPPLAQEKHMISVEAYLVPTSSEPPMTISLRKVVVDDQMMMDSLGHDYTMYEIREETDA